MDWQETKDEIARLTKQLNEELNPQYIPRFPWVLIYTLPREQRIGDIWMPDTKQNKTVHEGVVLRTWKSPHSYEINTRAQHKKQLEKDDSIVQESLSTTLYIYTELNEGDHVLYSHYAGWPVSKETNHLFRMVREYNANNGSVTVDDDCIFGKVEYSKESTLSEFSDYLKALEGNLYSEVSKKLMDKFIIHPKSSKTLSGV